MLVKYITESYFILCLILHVPKNIQCQKSFSTFSPSKESLGTYLKIVFNRYLKRTNAYIALRNGVSVPSDRKSFITLEPTRIGPGQADTWTGNDDLPLFDKVNSSIKLNRLFCVCWTLRLRKPLSAAFMNRRMFLG